tara:strand:+ start:204 stop:1019 length:816 start_codon:yes stop_codon:yes gene_type:complete
MKRNTKIILSLLALGVTATTIILLIRRRKKKKENEALINNTFTPNRVEEIVKTPLSITNPPTPTEIANVVDNGSIEVAIKNRDEGNAFRNWVNDNYPEYAKQIDLDRSGSHTNAYIKKAWKKYGTEYTQQNQTILGNIANTINESLKDNPAAQQVVSTIGTSFQQVGGGIVSLIDKVQGRTEIAQPAGAFDPAVAAQNLYNSMKGIGTNEDLFFNTLTPLTREQRIQVREYYDNNNVGKSLGTLEMSVRGDFGGLFSNKKELNRALALIEL